jgi:hypothetical protein
MRSPRNGNLAAMFAAARVGLFALFSIVVLGTPVQTAEPRPRGPDRGVTQCIFTGGGQVDCEGGIICTCCLADRCYVCDKNFRNCTVERAAKAATTLDPGTGQTPKPKPGAVADPQNSGTLSTGTSKPSSPTKPGAKPKSDIAPATRD